MQTIACLGWGSLVWDPRGLPTRGGWFNDGPSAPVEFLRQSKDGRITLVIAEGVQPVRLLWAVLDVPNIEDARSALGAREGIPARNYAKHVGAWEFSEGAPPATIPTLNQWAESRKVDGVVWTALPPKFRGQEGYRASADEIIAYLASLEGRESELAEHYVRNAPRQIDTPFRRSVEAALNWNPKEG